MQWNIASNAIASYVLSLHLIAPLPSGQKINECRFKEVCIGGGLKKTEDLHVPFLPCVSFSRLLSVSSPVSQSLVIFIQNYTQCLL